MGWWLLGCGDCYWQVKRKPHRGRVFAIAGMVISQSNNSLVKLDTNLFGDYQLFWLLMGFWQLFRQREQIDASTTRHVIKDNHNPTTAIPHQQSLPTQASAATAQQSHRIFVPQHSKVTRTHLTFSNPIEPRMPENA